MAVKLRCLVGFWRYYHIRIFRSRSLYICICPILSDSYERLFTGPPRKRIVSIKKLVVVILSASIFDMFEWPTEMSQGPWAPLADDSVNTVMMWGTSACSGPLPNTAEKPSHHLTFPQLRRLADHNQALESSWRDTKLLMVQVLIDVNGRPRSSDHETTGSAREGTRSYSASFTLEAERRLIGLSL
jgi:hypothetical protein